MTKKKVIEAVNFYKRVFSKEYDEFIKTIPLKKKLRFPNGKTKGDEVVSRIVSEYPETLYTMFNLSFSKEDWAWFDSEQGRKWFFKEYLEFRASEKY